MEAAGLFFVSSSRKDDHMKELKNEALNDSRLITSSFFCSINGQRLLIKRIWVLSLEIRLS